MNIPPDGKCRCVRWTWGEECTLRRCEREAYTGGLCKECAASSYCATLRLTEEELRDLAG
jgi:hypothetical protein